MEIKLKVDYDGNPYISLYSGGNLELSAEEELLEVFIRKAKEKGIIIINEKKNEKN